MNKRIVALSFGILLAGGCLYVLAINIWELAGRDGLAAKGLEVVSCNDSVLLVDRKIGKTWIFGFESGGKPGWFPLPPIEKDELVLQLKAGNQEKNAKRWLDVTDPSLQSVMVRDGYLCVKLDQCVSGYLGIRGRINGKSVNLMVDTGAADTYLDRTRTKDLDLKWERTTAADFCRIDTMELGSFCSNKIRVIAHDLSSINNAMQPYGDPLFDGVLGGNVLSSSLAIIDYRTYNLYLLQRR